MRTKLNKRKAEVLKYGKCYERKAVYSGKVGDGKGTRDEKGRGMKKWGEGRKGARDEKGRGMKEED
jgi:hypothetical protein